uniref:Protease Do-like PDZ domain-containing protein n=1 Tax=Zooxanthella nutricula TaxID=1333877 RepID=A0A7S2J476_9DINO
MCSSVLAHEVNEGFADLAISERLHKVNSVAVRNMRHLVELLSPLLDPSVQPPPRSHVVLQFACPRASVVFEVQALRESTPVILEQHKVPRWTNATLPTGAAEVQR